MSEEPKKLELSEDDLENIAGGTTAQNLEILNAMMKVDALGVRDVLDAVNEAGAENADSIITQGVNGLIQKHLGNSVIFAAKSGETQNWSFSGYDGKLISHQDVLDKINALSQGFDLMK